MHRPSLQEMQEQWQNQVATQNAETVQNALDEGKAADFDQGNIMPLADLSVEGQYLIRIWPRFDAGLQWWFDAKQYMTSPQGLKRGFSPITFGEPDPFNDYISGSFPYDKENRINSDFRQLRPRDRVLCIVQFREAQGFITGKNEPNKLYVLSMPRKKNGFEDYVQPQITKWATAGANPVDLWNGYDAVFQVSGKEMNKKTPALFEFVGHPGPANADPNLTQALYEQYMLLSESFYKLTPEDLQAMIDWWKPVVEHSLANPMGYVCVSNPRMYGQAKAAAEQYMRGGGGTPPALPTDAVQQPPVQPMAPPMGQPQMGQPPAALPDPSTPMSAPYSPMTAPPTAAEPGGPPQMAPAASTPMPQPGGMPAPAPSGTPPVSAPPPMAQPMPQGQPAMPPMPQPGGMPAQPGAMPMQQPTGQPGMMPPPPGIQANPMPPGAAPQQPPQAAPPLPGNLPPGATPVPPQQ